MKVTLIVNKDRRDLDLEAHRTLAQVLREAYGLTSAHLDCVDGTCGACTVIVDGEAIRSCLMLAVQCDGAFVRTAEGLVADHPLRAALFAEKDAQCGNCGPGLVMLAAGAMHHDPGLATDPQRLGRLLDSNVCRRSGHDIIQQTVVRAACRL